MPKKVQGIRASTQLRDEQELVGRTPLQLDEVIVPVADVGGDFPSHVWSKGQGYAMGHIEHNTVAVGEHGAVWLVNRAGSGVVALVDLVRVSITISPTGSATSMRVDMGIGQSFADIPGGNAEAVDHRRPGATDIGPGSATLELTSNDQVGPLGNPIFSFALFAPAPGKDRDETNPRAVLVPGSTLVLIARQPDLDLVADFRWIERPARIGEIQ